VWFGNVPKRKSERDRQRNAESMRWGNKNYCTSWVKKVFSLSLLSYLTKGRIILGTEIPLKGRIDPQSQDDGDTCHTPSTGAAAEEEIFYGCHHCRGGDIHYGM
jgi:hypothetical protein